ncbi:hypothetical protein PIROE2DRAFT_2151 [Piromyces sp. E2]|nr:hypothetical protein PIROE2DRAFT_2151 [Piromyces sp. E2]|eukprot:OUM69947.1 hypothetical protein PIROE2DRAFT_2151 [Piromyces sp. E2]
MNNKFQFVPPPKLPLQNHIPGNSEGDSNTELHSLIQTHIKGQNNNMNNINNIYYPQFINNNDNTVSSNSQVLRSSVVQNRDSNIFNSFNSIDTFNQNKDQKQDFKINNESKDSTKNSLLSEYIERDNQWFKNWFNSEDRNQINNINSYKKMKYLDVLKSFLEVYNNIQKMKDIKNHLEKDKCMEGENETELQLKNFNETINSCNLIQRDIAAQFKKLNNVNAISNWKFKRNKMKKRRNKLKNDTEKNKEEEIVLQNIENSEIHLHPLSENVLNIEKSITTDINKDKTINEEKKQKSEKNPDQIECQKLIDLIQKLQKIRNIRRSKEVKKQDILCYENKPNIINIDEKIEELSHIIKPSKNKKKRKKKNRISNNGINNNTNNTNISHNQNNSLSNVILSSQNHNHIINFPKNNTPIFLKKKKTYHFTEKNKRLLKIKCEPYSNVYEYFNHTKLDIKSLIYIRKEWDKYIVKEGILRPIYRCRRIFENYI